MKRFATGFALITTLLLPGLSTPAHADEGELSQLLQELKQQRELLAKQLQMLDQKLKSLDARVSAEAKPEAEESRTGSWVTHGKNGPVVITRSRTLAPKAPLRARSILVDGDGPGVVRHDLDRLPEGVRDIVITHLENTPLKSRHLRLLPGDGHAHEDVHVYETSDGRKMEVIVTERQPDAGGRSVRAQLRAREHGQEHGLKIKELHRALQRVLREHDAPREIERAIERALKEHERPAPQKERRLRMFERREEKKTKRSSRERKVLECASSPAAAATQAATTQAVSAQAAKDACSARACEASSCAAKEVKVKIRAAKPGCKVIREPRTPKGDPRIF